MKIEGAFDIETTQPFDTPSGKAVRCFLACIYYKELGKKVDVFYEAVFEDIADFIYWCEDKEGSIFCHNLKFEVSYMLPYLLLNEIPYEILESTFNIYTFKLFGLTFKCTGNFYVGQRLDDIAMRVLGYGKIEHDVRFPKDHKATKKDIEYCLRDCKITYEIAQEHIERMIRVASLITDDKSTLDGLRKKITNAGMAYSVFLATQDPDKYNALFPLLNREVQDFMRGAYFGGLVGIKKGVHKNVYSYDIVNSYPSVMISRDFPAGKPIYTTNIDDFKDCTFWIGKFEATNIRRHKDSLPTLLKKKMGVNEGIDKAEVMQFTMCCNDYEMFCENYTWDTLKFSDGYYFTDIVSGEEIFGTYIKEFSKLSRELKAQGKQAERDIVKIFLNGLYGKFSTRNITDDYKHFIDDKKIVKRGIIGESYKEELDIYYLPLGIYITSYARETLNKAVNNVGFTKVVNYDTDSIKSLVPLDDSFLGSEMGRWGFEFKADVMKCIAPKTYAYTYTNSKGEECFNIKAKGISKQAIKTAMQQQGMALFDKFSDTLTFRVLQAKRMIGGTGIIEMEKQLVIGGK